MNYFKKILSINSKKEIPSDVVPTKAKEIGLDKLTFEELKLEINKTFGNTADLQSDVIRVGKSDGRIYYLETVVNTEMLKEMLGNTLENSADKDIVVETIEDLHNLSKRSFGVSGYKLLKTVNEIVSSLLEGRIVIVFRGVGQALSLNYINSEGRAVAEPTTQTVVRGPKDSFVEDATTNINLIRKRIRNHHLRFEKFMLGNETRTNVYMGYMYSIANEKIVNEVRSRLNKIDISAVFESANVEELIIDKSLTVFPLAMNTERPDAVATYLMDAKIVIIIDGSPFVLIVPAVLTDFFTSPEDNYQNYFMSSFVRMIRYLSFMIGLIMPSAYVGVLTFHPELLPTTLLLSVIAQREDVPFPAVVEVFIMEITFEILREAGVRMPRAVGQTVSIVGALVIGQAAAEAGIISNIMVIIVAITAIANFVFPNYNFANASRLIRFVLIIVASVLGLYGVLLVLVFMVAHLSSLRSFGVPYLAPVAPFIVEDQKDVFVRFPLWAISKRPSYLSPNIKNKQKPQGSPSPPKHEGGDKK
ncbi:spore germination protein [Niallia sp. MER TA 168]|uniref:spore germination protein n=1 Tax=Niallia sp. MER TA 168 TaxID=2939568 RepID=UPI00203FAF46|nr:spore germination protein [Niallia sp. MER TA 168]MCM3361173.1 spore germination protein [Niallia sp. MER TA 168]